MNVATNYVYNNEDIFLSVYFRKFPRPWLKPPKVTSKGLQNGLQNKMRSSRLSRLALEVAPKNLTLFPLWRLALEAENRSLLTLFQLARLALEVARFLCSVALHMKDVWPLKQQVVAFLELLGGIRIAFKFEFRYHLTILDDFLLILDKFGLLTK